MKVAVYQLKPGDVLKGTGESIRSVSAGVFTPTGKMDVLVERNGVVRGSQWNRHTMVHIEERKKNT